MRSQLLTRRRVTAGLVAGTLLLAACGGADDGTDAGSGEEPAQVEGTDSGDGAQADTGSAPSAPTAVDLVGVDVLAASDFEGNLLPDVVVDDINTGRKVNFKNLVPQEKPILLWMYAPH